METQSAIMDERFTYLRLSQSCLGWVVDTIWMRYAGLEDIQRTSLTREMKLRRTSLRPNAESSSTSLAYSGRSRGRSVSGDQQRGTPGITLSSWSSAQAQAARNAPGHTVLFKGIDQGRIRGLFDESGNLADISKLESERPTDFSPLLPLYYFSPDIKVAEHYASYAKNRSISESIVIVCLTIPNSAIESLQKPDIHQLFFPDPEWKELVWRSHRRMKLPTHLGLYQQAILVIGTISKGPHRMFVNLNSSQEVTEKHVLRVGARGEGPRAVQ